MMIYLSIILSLLAVIVIPTLALIMRAAVRWKGIEDKIDNVVGDLNELVRDKDKVHQELAMQMREDRKATNQRLRWLEENVWKGHTN